MEELLAVIENLNETKQEFLVEEFVELLEEIMLNSSHLLKEPKFVSSMVERLPALYKLLEEFFKDFQDGGKDRCFCQVLYFLSSCSDGNVGIVHEINSSGFLIDHVFQLDALPRIHSEDKIDEEKLMELAMLQLTIIFNCVSDPNLPRYYFGGAIKWSTVFSPWSFSTHSAPRLFSKFILSYLLPALDDSSLQLLEISGNDQGILMNLLDECSHPPDFKGTILGFSGSSDLQESIMQSLREGVTLDELPASIEGLTIVDNEIKLVVDDSECEPYCMSAIEVVGSLQNLISKKQNLFLLKEPVFMPSILRLLESGQEKEKIAASKLLLYLKSTTSMSLFSIVNLDANHHSHLLKLLQQHSSSHCLELKDLCDCLLLEDQTDSDFRLEYAKLCYTYRWYEQCVTQCKRVSGNAEASILHAKSLYHLYTLEQVALDANIRDSYQPIARKDHEVCYLKARKVVSILGELLDREEPLFDEECSEMLDLAMIDYAFETNKLSEVRRCLLCRTFQGKLAHKSTGGNKAEKEQASQTEGSRVRENPPKHSDKKFGLQASHLFPRSIIKHFVSAVPLAKGKKVCSIKGFKPQFDPSEGSLHSFGECKLYLLCHDCEELLSATESWFLDNVFTKIYNTQTPDSATAEKSIPYNPQLYKFCVGLVFRLLRYESIRVLNPSDIYHLFKSCRNILLSSDSPPKGNELEIYTLITPMYEEEGEVGKMNSFLTGTMANLFGFHSLHSDFKSAQSVTPAFAHFFVIHMGIFNVLVKFKPSEKYQIDVRFRICEEGGVYTVPVHEDRMKYIPSGMHALFQFKAMRMEKEWLEGPALSYVPLEEPKESAMKTYGILEAESKDHSRIIAESKSHSFSEDYSKVLCFLPPGFAINPPLTVPHNHKILLHHTHGDKETGTIVFLCIGISREDGYGLDKPYIVIYNYRPGYVFSAGFFIDTYDLTPVEFLPNHRGTGSVSCEQDMLGDLRGKQDFEPIIGCALQEKGFYSIQSLVQRLEVLYSRFGSIPLFDAQCTPCSSEILQRCIYCVKRCDVCFNATPQLPLTLSGPEDSDLDFMFCSPKCLSVSTQPPKSKSYVLFKSNGETMPLDKTSNNTPFLMPHCCPLYLTHKLLLHAVCLDTNYAGYLRQTEFALCLGSFKGHPNDQFYVVHHARSLTGQLSYEYFLDNNTLSPSNMLPYLKNEDLALDFEEMKTSQDFEEHLKSVIDAINKTFDLKIPSDASSLITLLPNILESIQ